MKFNSCILVLTITLVLSNYNTPHTIIVDLHEFLTTPNKTTASSHLGRLALAFSWLSLSRPQNLEDEFFAFLHSIDIPNRNNDPSTKIMRGLTEIPGQYHDLYSGNKSWQTILAEIKTAIDNNNNFSSSKKELMKKVAEISFDPTVNTKVMDANPEADALIKQLTKAGHTIHLLGNATNETVALFEQKMPSTFTQINGETIFSSRIGTTRGAAMFNNLFDSHAIDPQTTVCIETHEQHAQNTVQTFQTRYDTPVETVVYTYGTIKKVQDRLRALDILTDE